MSIKIFIYTTLTLLIGSPALLRAQISEALALDTYNKTRTVLSFSYFYKQILENHPIVKQANLLNDAARQKLRETRGAGFDPKLKSDFSRKEFKTTDYFNIWKTALSVPLPIGKVEVGYERMNGIFLNPENTLPNNGLGFVGISVPLARGIVTNARRATLRQAKNMIEMAKADRRELVNEVLLQSVNAYWDWYLAHRQYLLIREGYKLADLRFKAVKQRVSIGELAGIDSVKAKIVWQKRKYELQDIQTKAENARIKLSNFLWGDNNLPLEISGNMIPADQVPYSMDQTPVLGKLLEQAQSHPALVSLGFQQKNLKVEERLQRDQMKPKIDLKYQILTNPVGTAQDKAIPVAFQENYKVGFSFEFPLFLRKASGKTQQIRIKQSQTELKVANKQREIRNKVVTYFNQLNNTRELIKIQRGMVNNYEILRRGELRKFNIGESTLFLVNTRENQLIESRMKLAKLEAKYHQYYAKLRWATGQSPVE
ncbi:hypothetical protein BKI52_01740 [marine bacterium AO1-C]|nr:hypothetical protein BKI52_01740 [marine bacterium AO1-C]